MIDTFESSTATLPAADSKSADKKLRVWIVEDHVIFRDLLADYLRGTSEVTLQGQSDNDIELLAACERGEVDAVVLDLNLTQTGGLAILEKLRQTRRPPAVMILSATVTEHSIQHAVRLGAQAYVEKAASLEEVRQAILRLREGKAYFSNHASRIMTKLAFRDPRSEGRLDLTARETELLRDLALDVSIKDIATRLNLSKWSVYRMRSDLMQKLGTRSTEDLVSYAFKIGLIQAVPHQSSPSSS
jgi:DNA-binding NarL/FixJ family response regulator